MAIEQYKFEPAPIDPSWIISGTPVFHTALFERSRRWGLSGVWKCIGPGKFIWHYTADELIYVLEGSGEVEYLGKKFLLQEDDSIRFAAGTTATWTVTNHIKKIFRIENTGFLVRLSRFLPLRGAICLVSLSLPI